MIINITSEPREFKVNNKIHKAIVLNRFDSISDPKTLIGDTISGGDKFLVVENEKGKYAVRYDGNYYQIKSYLERNAI